MNFDRLKNYPCAERFFSRLKMASCSSFSPHPCNHAIALNKFWQFWCLRRAGQIFDQRKTWPRFWRANFWTAMHLYFRIVKVGPFWIEHQNAIIFNRFKIRPVPRQRSSFSFSESGCSLYSPLEFNTRKISQHLTNWSRLNKSDEVWNRASALFVRRFLPLLSSLLKPLFAARWVIWSRKTRVLLSKSCLCSSASIKKHYKRAASRKIRRAIYLTTRGPALNKLGALCIYRFKYLLINTSF